jgi:hypothetical protein
MTNLGTAIASECGTAYAAGRDWANALKAGDKFEGAAPEATKRYNDETEQSMFIAGAMKVLDERALYIAMGEGGSTITRIERPDPDGTPFFLAGDKKCAFCRMLGHACREHERNSDKAAEEPRA